MNHDERRGEERRGSWAVGWGRKVARYPHGLPIRLAGYAPRRVRLAPAAAWHAERGISLIGAGSMAVRMRAVGLTGGASPRGYKAHDWGSRGVRGLGVARVVPSALSGHLRGRISAAQRWDLRRAKRMGLSAGQGSVGVRLGGLAVMRRGTRLLGHAATTRLVKAASGAIGDHAVAPIKYPGREGGFAGAAGPDSGHGLAGIPPRDRGLAEGQAAQGQAVGRLARSRRGNLEGETVAASMGHRISARGETMVRATDHAMMGWLGRAFGDEARRPPSGPTRCDGHLAPIYPGRKPGF